MAFTDINNTTRTDMDNTVSDFEIDAGIIDEESTTGTTEWISSHFSEYIGYYKTIPELKKAIDALADWTIGRGYKTDGRTTNMLKLISGWGEDTFQSILWNMLVIKKINGDSFAEIMRDPNNPSIIINIKPLNPSRIKIVVNQKGRIKHYEELGRDNKAKRKFKPKDILHLSNDRVANEIHGVSVVEACKWVIDARNEAMRDWRRILHRNLAAVRIIEVDEDDTTRLNKLKNIWEEAVDKGDVMIMPKGVASPVNTDAPVNPESWIRYLENFFYQAVGVPKIILGGSQEFTEASSKIGYLTFEQVYMSEQRLLEQDIFAQLGLTIKFERPVSIKEDIVSSEAANTGQVGFQPNEVNTGVTRTE